MPRRRLVVLALFCLIACSGGGPAPKPPGAATASRSGSPAPAAESGPRVVLERNRTLYVWSGGRERRISTQGFYPGGSRAGEPPLTVSPNGRWALAYTATRPGWFVLPIAGGAAVRLPGAAKLPVWSRDSTIAYVADGDLHLVVPGRRAAALLAPAPEGCCFALAWSADGRRLALEGYDRTLGRSQIWVVDRTGRGLERIWGGRAAPEPKGWALSFSPDGEHVVSGNAEKPVAVEVSSHRAHDLEAAPVLRDAGHTWWRNRILVRTRAEPVRLGWEDPGGDAGLVLPPEPVAFATEVALAPGGSPLGMTIARREDKKTALFTARPDGTALKRLIEWGESISAMGWSGGWLAFEAGKARSLRAVLPAGGTSRSLGTGRLRAGF